MMVQELWYDPTLGHSHLRELLLDLLPLCLIYYLKAYPFFPIMDSCDDSLHRDMLIHVRV